MSAFIIGSTGLVGNFIVKHSTDYYQKVFTLSRSQPDFTSDSKIHPIKEKDSTKWSDALKNTEGPIDTFFSGLGTTKAKAGGIENQYKIDYELNLELAKAAKAKGFKKYVLVSSMGASSTSRFPYMKMKGELEDAVIDLGFDNTIILRPGALCGERKEDKGFLNNVMVSVASCFIDTPMAKYVMAPIHGEQVAIAALKLAAKPSAEKVIIVSGTDLNKAAKE